MLPQPQDSSGQPSTFALRSLLGLRPTASRSAHPNLTRAIVTEETDKTAVTPAAEETMPSEETTMPLQCRRRPSNEPGTGAVSPDNTDEKQRGRPFEKGTSGNPSGRPRGSRNATTLALEVLLDGQAQALTQKAIDLALTGDIPALRLCLDRILPPRKDRPVSFTLPTD